MEFARLRTPTPVPYPLGGGGLCLTPHSANFDDFSPESGAGVSLPPIGFLLGRGQGWGYEAAQIPYAIALVRTVAMGSGQ
jgi:hypothetical protein